MEQTRSKQRPLGRAEADEILDAATRLEMQTDDQGLSLADLKQIGAEIGLSAEHIDHAAALVEDRRQERERRRAQRRRGLTMGVAATGLAGLLVLAGLLGSRGALLTQQAQVEQRRAQLDNTKIRRHAVEQRLKDAPQSHERDAELSGSENRVAIEAKRYDEAVGQYNETAQALLGRGARALFSLPPPMPFSPQLSP